MIRDSFGASGDEDRSITSFSAPLPGFNLGGGDVNASRGGKSSEAERACEAERKSMVRFRGSGVRSELLLWTEGLESGECLLPGDGLVGSFALLDGVSGNVSFALNV